MHRRRLISACAGVLLLAGCSAPPSLPDEVTASASRPSSSSSAAASVPPSAPPSGSADPVPSGTASGSVAPSESVSTAATPCTPERMEVALGGSDPGAGHIDYRIVFTNRAIGACTLSGPPSVAFRGPDGSQAGKEADPTAVSGPVVRVASGASASATVSVVNVGTDGGPLAGRCDPVRGVGFFVDLPQTFGLKQVSADVRGCTDLDTSFMTVTPITGS